MGTAQLVFAEDCGDCDVTGSREPEPEMKGR
jgi:hypothetical protein